MPADAYRRLPVPHAGMDESIGLLRRIAAPRTRRARAGRHHPRRRPQALLPSSGRSLIRHLLLPKIARTHPLQPPEEARKIRHVGKTQQIGNLGDRHGRVDQIALRLEQNATVYMLERSASQRPAADIVELRRRDGKLRSVQGDGPMLAKMLLDQPGKGCRTLLSSVWPPFGFSLFVLLPPDPTAERADQRMQREIAPRRYGGI